MIGALGGRSSAVLLVHSMLIQAVTFLLRPATSYRALELDVPGFALGALAATFAVVPLVLAIPTGGLVDRLGEKRLMVLGSLVVLVASMFMLVWGTSISALIAGNALLGAGHLACVVGQQAVVANNARFSGLDSGFGYLTFAASLGQALGPLVISVAGGAAVSPDTGAMFIFAAGMSLALLLTSFFMPGAATGKRSTDRQDGAGRSTMSLLRSPGVVQALVTSATVLAVVDLTVVYLPALGAERGLAASTVGLMLAVRAAFSMVSRLGLGHLSKWMGRTRLMLWSLALSAVTLSLATVPMPTWLLFVVLAALGLGLGIGQPLTMSWLTTRAPSGQRGRALALRLAGNRVGQVILPSTIGVVAAGAGAGGVLVAAAAVVGGTIFLFRGKGLDHES